MPCHHCLFACSLLAAQRQIESSHASSGAANPLRTMAPKLVKVVPSRGPAFVLRQPPQSLSDPAPTQAAKTDSALCIHTQWNPLRSLLLAAFAVLSPVSVSGDFSWPVLSCPGWLLLPGLGLSLVCGSASRDWRNRPRVSVKLVQFGRRPI